MGILRERDEKGKFLPTHNMRNTRLYKIWCSMKERCNNQNNKNYKNYGEKGIKVCKKWAKDFLEFYRWATNNGYKEGLTIDRINFSGDYEPENCRWVTTKQQNRNYSKNRFIKYKNKKYCIVELSEKFDIPYRTLLYRINAGYTIEKAIIKKDFRGEKNGKKIER